MSGPRTGSIPQVLSAVRRGGKPTRSVAPGWRVLGGYSGPRIRPPRGNSQCPPRAAISPFRACICLSRAGGKPCDTSESSIGPGPVFPAQAGNHAFVQPRWSPAFAGETSVVMGETCADTGETRVSAGETRVVPRKLLRQKLNEWAEMLEDRTGLEAREVGA